MFDQEKLVAVIAAYKDYFPNHWKDEKYKWEAIQYFQEHWNISAENFLDMFMEATDKTYNLLANMNNYPRGMIKSFAMADQEAVRSMFMALFDESQNLAQRIEQFITSAENLRVKYDDGTWKQHYQTANAISTYLWLMRNLYWNTSSNIIPICQKQGLLRSSGICLRIQKRV